MKIVAGFVAVAMLGVLAVGCGGDDEELSDGELANIEARFAQPDGTLSAGNTKSVIEGAKGNQSTASELNVTGNDVGGGSATTKSWGVGSSLRTLGIETKGENAFACNALMSGQQSGTCACPSGGSFTYSMSSTGQGGGPTSTLMKIRLDACATGTTTIDGHEYLSMQSDTSDRANPSFSMLFVIDATIRSPRETKKIDAQLRYSKGAAEIAVRVDDGWVIVGWKASSSGTGVTYTIRDKRGTWTCVIDADKATCTSPTGEKLPS